MASAPSGAGAITAFGTPGYTIQASAILGSVNAALSKLGLRLRNSNFSGPSFEYVGSKTVAPSTPTPASGWQMGAYQSPLTIADSIAMIDTKFDLAFRLALDVKTHWDGAMQNTIPHWEEAEAFMPMLDKYIMLTIAAGQNAVTGRAVEYYQGMFDAEIDKSALLQQIVDDFNVFFADLQGKLSTRFQTEIQNLVADKQVSQHSGSGYQAGTLKVSPTVSTYEWTKYGIKRWLGVDV